MVWWQPITTLASAVLIMYFVLCPHSTGTRFVGLGVFVFLGELSYTVYLVHFGVYLALLPGPRGTHWSFWPTELLRLAVVLGIAIGQLVPHRTTARSMASALSGPLTERSAVRDTAERKAGRFETGPRRLPPLCGVGGREWPGSSRFHNISTTYGLRTSVTSSGPMSTNRMRSIVDRQAPIRGRPISQGAGARSLVEGGPEHRRPI